MNLNIVIIKHLLIVKMDNCLIYVKQGLVLKIFYFTENWLLSN